MLITRKYRFVAFSALVAAITATIALVAATTSHSENSVGLRDATARLGILRHSPDGAFAPTAESKRAQPHGDQIPFALDPSATRVAQRGDDGQVLSVEAGDQGVCISDAEPEIGGGACAPIAQALDPGTPIIAWHPMHHERAIRVFGLFTDGTSDITVTAAGQTHPVAIVNNTISAAVPTDPSEVAWTDADGHHHTQHLVAEDPGGPGPPSEK